MKRTVQTIRVLTRNATVATGLLKVGGMTFPCSIGRSGKRFLKREGDGASPRGGWQVRRLFYRADRGLPPRTGLKAQAMRDFDGWCETVGDRNYNRLVRIPYATAHETMKRADHLYDVVVELSHNGRPRVQGHGSAVFFHLRQPDGGPTAGCVAVSMRDMRIILGLIGRHARIVI
ncbi:L,D-transpeptidase family protein [Aestuariivirga sp.]|uniref:L,D-transpeptidase family protein n=1 Tax=Aestuariivirga sp. TaxID=2650926 RepID=UPI0025B7F97D|nr:L,D-transpeptidase family protein [Aestuariivirga sp.]